MQRRGTLHPECVFTSELRQISGPGRRGILGLQQCDHLKEKWRLRASEIVRAGPVGDVSIPVNQRCEVPDHVLHQVLPPASRQTQHREIRVPVVQLSEAATRYHVGPGQGQRGRKRGDRRGIARQLRPQLIDVCGDRQTCGDGPLRPHRHSDVGRDEILSDELAQGLRRARPLRVEATQDDRRRRSRHSVRKGLAVREDSSCLDRRKQVLEQILRRAGCGCGTSSDTRKQETQGQEPAPRTRQPSPSRPNAVHDGSIVDARPLETLRGHLRYNGRVPEGGDRFRRGLQNFRGVPRCMSPR